MRCLPLRPRRPTTGLVWGRGNSRSKPKYIQAHRVNALFDAHRDDPEFGYRYLPGAVGLAGALDAEDSQLGAGCAGFR